MKTTYKKSIYWIRRSLRLKDNRALHEACAKSENVFVVFVFDTSILKHLPDNDRRITFIYESLIEIEKNLRDKGSKLFVLYGNPQEEILRFANQYKIEALFTNQDYEPYGLNRDQKIEEKLKNKNIHFYSFKDIVIFEKNEILNLSGKPFKVYSAYKRKWLSQITSEEMKEFKPHLSKMVKSSNISNKQYDLKPLEKYGFQKQKNNIISGGEKAADKSLKKFLDSNLKDYKIVRDIPHKNATSFLSPHLRFGTISVRKIVRELYLKREKAEVFLSEIIWRDFFHMILFHNPQVTKESFRKEFNQIKWNQDQTLFEVWKNGQTGFPIIDAAMRYFKQTGWMHNRLRMIVASFLVKDLLLDWRLGEAWFREKLLDYDLALNNGNWQWCASTGTDAQPYFRIFNPITQGERFDADGTFIKRHLPELKNVPKKFIHEPWKMNTMEQHEYNCILGKDYPFPIVDHAEQRKHAIHMFELARKTA